jgi:hypothetical protein
MKTNASFSASLLVTLMWVRWPHRWPSRWIKLRVLLHATQAGGIEWRKDNNVDAAFALAKSAKSRYFFTGERSGARLAIRSRQRYSIVRNSLISHGILFLCIWMAIARERRNCGAIQSAVTRR